MHKLKSIIRNRIEQNHKLHRFADYPVFSDIINKLYDEDYIKDIEYQTIINHAMANMWVSQENYNQYVNNQTADSIYIEIQIFKIQAINCEELIIAINPQNRNDFKILSYSEAIDYFIDGETSVWH